MDLASMDADLRTYAFCAAAGLFGGTVAAVFKEELTKRQFLGYTLGGFTLGLFGSGPVCRYYNADSGIAGGIALALGLCVAIVVPGIQALASGRFVRLVSKEGEK